MDKKEIKQKYKKLLDEVEHDNFYKMDLSNRINCYICKCGQITKTKDIDPGVTPFMISCIKCGGDARSTFYTDIVPKKEIDLEWYRPSLEELLKMNDGVIDHVLQGGLYYRPYKS